MITLKQIWEQLKDAGYETDKGSVHSYIPFYEELLKDYRISAANVLEIGLFNGHSIRMWEQYFKGNVYGVDCSDQPHGGLADLRPILNEPGHNIHIIDATNKQEVYDTFGNKLFDVIIEDAGHDLQQQIDLFNLWRAYLAPGGLYVIEDVQDIDSSRREFERIGGEVIDRRHIKNRYDDVLVILRR